MASVCTDAMNYRNTTTQEATSEYFPRPEESNGNGNGNGNGDGKIFQLKPAVDPVTLAIIEARTAAKQDARLNRSMKTFFYHILDIALDPAFCHPHPRGVVSISDTANARIFGVSNRSIYEWKKTVEAAGHFWLTELPRDNMWSITTYHLSCLHQPPRGKTDHSATYGSSGLGRRRPVGGMGARRPGQPFLPLPGSRQRPPEVKNSQVPAIAGLTGSQLPVSPEASFR